MNNWTKEFFVIILILAFTPLAFALMPLIVIIAIGGGVYMMTVTWKKQHHFEH